MSSYILDISCSPYNESDKRNIRICIKCLADSTLDTKIFAYRLIDDEWAFDHVCSTVDMVEYPSTEPSTGESFKWLRKDTVDILVRTFSIAEDFITEVKSDVEMLYSNMQAHNSLVGETSYYVGAAVALETDANTEITVATVAPTYTLTLTQPTSGTVNVSTTTSGQTLIYTPKADFAGIDTFMYSYVTPTEDRTSVAVKITVKANGGMAFSQIVASTITAATNITYTTPTMYPHVEGTTSTTVDQWLTGTTRKINIFDKLSDHSGVITKVDDLTLKYTPATGFTGTDSFKYTITDGTRYASILCQLTVQGTTNE